MSDLKDYIIFFKNGKTINIKANRFCWKIETLDFYSYNDPDEEDENLVAVFNTNETIGVSEVFEDNSENTTQLVANDKETECICYKCTNYPGCFDFREDICSCGNFSQRYFPAFYPTFEDNCKKCIKKDECSTKSTTNGYTPVKCDGYKEKTND